MTDSRPAVLVDRLGAVGRLTLNRPDKLNALSSAVHQGLIDGLAGFEADRAVRAVLLCAAGPHFSAGADLAEVDAARTEAARLERFVALAHRAARRLETSRLPVVAAVQGYCLAGGLELMLAADVVFLADDARVGDQHARFGLVPGGGATQRLPRLVGLRRALDLMLSGRHLDAAEAERWGLANRVVPAAQLAAAAAAYATALSVGNPDGLAFIKATARRGAEMSPSDGLTLEEAGVVRELMSDNAGEGIAAFRAKREPRFS